MRRRSSATPAGAAAVGALRRPTGAAAHRADGHSHGLWRPGGREEQLLALEHPDTGRLTVPSV
ncbi:hypothetical protein CHLRE_12g485478v5 [Chlamydomonas reinhardtii]|uniref:Uncharacterized protein n=1 Tax=Chlamydomonas reinhardtii TaxID=3055 RepID=A0A2K3D1S6_CHLRE|nr:uncharacterized protein CHLRE_12g485478v5 [Chlamydomonas reinhardtii]PNW74475.1 hypothetical protein CHLRE_12g485478v5 [Chlamydomonas reinhardtii]